MKKNISFFKPYILSSISTYKGGKTKDQIQTDKKIHKLSSNENLLGSSPLALKALRENINSLNEYPEQKGGSLQVALSEFYNGELKPEQFITDNSGVGILELITHAFLGEGLECIVSNPTFIPYIQFPKQVGAIIKDVPLKSPDFSLDVEGIIAAINDNTRVIWLCSPNNPTGTYIPKAKIDELISLIPNHVVIVYDEVYHQFATAEDYTRGLPYVLEGKNVIAVNSFSKAYGLAGLRIGYAYSTVEIAQYMNQIRRPFLLNTLALKAAIAALKDVDFIDRTVKNVNAGKAFLYPKLDELGIHYWKSQANFFLMKPAMNDLEFEEKMQKEGIMIRPVANFGAPDCIRVTIGTPEANEAFVAAITQVL
ncbi:MAG: pyridoxal phosphate-dependent aminotransferase [Chitinophagales bacterium]